MPVPIDPDVYQAPPPHGIETGVSPKAAGEYVDRLREQVRALDEIAGQIARAYDAELFRVYGYEFCRPLPGGADSTEALRAARARWAEAIAAFTMPSVDGA